MVTRATTRTLSLLSSRSTTTTTSALLSRATFPLVPPSPSCCPLSSATPYPLYYELISYRPPRRPPRLRRRGAGTPAAAALQPQPPEGAEGEDGDEAGREAPALDRSKRKYYRKRAKRMYGGSDSDDDDGAKGQSEFVELEPEVVDFPRLHAREEELYFYDAFAFPWEKEKHYRMVYQLEKKYFPDQCLDKAFVEPVPEPPVVEVKAEEEEMNRGRWRSGSGQGNGERRDERGLVFFEQQGEVRPDKKGVAPAAVGGVSEKKVEEFFQCLKKVPTAAGVDRRAVATTGEPFLASRKTGLPPKWDGPSGTVLLVDKPKGWTSFTVCGKLRRLVKVQKVPFWLTLLFYWFQIRCLC
uniref:tRNA pseudouridine synthase B n=1 Tax=Anthurium amnicola TaxID=1678845 RepID=A0A1D1Z721_9ARAE